MQSLPGVRAQHALRLGVLHKTTGSPQASLVVLYSVKTPRLTWYSLTNKDLQVKHKHCIHKHYNGGSYSMEGSARPDSTYDSRGVINITSLCIADGDYSLHFNLH